MLSSEQNERMVADVLYQQLSGRTRPSKDGPISSPKSQDFKRYVEGKNLKQLATDERSMLDFINQYTVKEHDYDMYLRS